MSNDAPTRSLRLIASCPDRIGIVARVATFLADRGASITQANQFEDLRTSTFFMRYGFDIPESDGMVEAIAEDFQLLADEFKMDWKLRDLRQRQRAVLLVSKTILFA